MNLLRLAWRNIWRNRRRSLITMGAITFSVLLIAFAHSVQTGTYEAMERHAVRLFSGEVQIHRAGYQEEQTFNYALTSAEQPWPGLLSSTPGITGFAKRLTGFGLVSSDASSTGAAILGIEPEAERAVTHFSAQLTQGTLLQAADDHAVLLGHTMAENLAVGVDDSVVVLTQGYRNEMGADLYRVKGLLRTGAPEMDRAMMVMTLADAQALFSMPGRFTTLVLRTTDLQHADRYAAQLQAILPAADYEVMPWRTLMPALQQTRALDDAGNMIFYFFLLLLLGFEIFNTTTMSTLERTQEFGVMQAIGMKPHQISLLVGAELFIKVFLALGVGLLTILVLALMLEDQSIPLSQDLIEIYQNFGFNVEAITFSVRPQVFIQPMTWVAIVSLLAMVYPVFKVQRLTPMAALSKR